MSEESDNPPSEPTEGVEEIEVEPLAEPAEPEGGEIDPADTHTEGQG